MVITQVKQSVLQYIQQGCETAEITYSQMITQLIRFVLTNESLKEACCALKIKDETIDAIVSFLAYDLEQFLATDDVKVIEVALDQCFK